MSALRSSSILVLVAAMVVVMRCVTRADGGAVPQQPGFGAPAPKELALAQFADHELADLLARLDSSLNDRPAAPSAADARRTLSGFVSRLQAGRLTASQEASVVDRLAALGRAHSAYLDEIDQAILMVRTLTVGKFAPETAGRDLNGRPFKLSDYRGKIVVLAFSADWCGICRSQYPYFRLMQELYANWPFAILGVEAGALDSTRRLRAEQGLTYRSWWDGPDGENGRGPIASAWHVPGWPTTYVLDADGVIRFIDLREEDLLKGVRQLLNEQMDRLSVASAQNRQ